MANDKAARLATALRANADQLRQHLPGGDTQLVSINNHEAALLHQLGGSGKRDPITGIISFDDGDGGGDGGGGEGGDSDGADAADGSSGAAGTSPGEGLGMTFAPAPQPVPAAMASAPAPAMPAAAAPIGPGVPMPGASPMANQVAMAKPPIPLMGAPVIGQSPNQALAQALRG